MEPYHNRIIIIKMHAKRSRIAVVLITLKLQNQLSLEISDVFCNGVSVLINISICWITDHLYLCNAVSVPLTRCGPLNNFSSLFLRNTHPLMVEKL